MRYRFSIKIIIITYKCLRFLNALPLEKHGKSRENKNSYFLRNHTVNVFFEPEKSFSVEVGGSCLPDREGVDSTKRNLTVS